MPEPTRWVAVRMVARVAWLMVGGMLAIALMSDWIRLVADVLDLKTSVAPYVWVIWVGRAAIPLPIAVAASAALWLRRRWRKGGAE